MEPFILFGDQHTQTLIWSTIIIIAICVAANFANNSSQSILTKIIGLSLLVFEATKPFIYIFSLFNSFGLTRNKTGFNETCYAPTACFPAKRTIGVCV